jgi:hypothetical protein
MKLEYSFICLHYDSTIDIIEIIPGGEIGDNWRNYLSEVGWTNSWEDETIKHHNKYIDNKIFYISDSNKLKGSDMGNIIISDVRDFKLKEILSSNMRP